jgi:hypothetical protein
MLTIDKIKKIAKRQFETKARKFRVVARATYQMANYWDGGSREYCVALNLATGETRVPDFATTNPLEGPRSAAHAEFAIPAGFGILAHSIYCGKDCGITLYVSADTERTLTAGPSDLRSTVEVPAISMAELVEQRS